MRISRSMHRAAPARRWAPLVAAAALVALLSGCVLYPVGGGGWHRDHYEQRGDWR
jgi:hypothetical protein